MYSEIVVWGTYDLGKPRVRILLKAIKSCGIDVVEVHGDVWKGIEDKTQVRGVFGKARLAFKWLARYPALISGFLKQPKRSLVLVPYMGHFDVLILWPFARIRGCRIVWDAFISLYNTVVEDRRLVSKRNPVAWLVYAFEWLATRAADQVVLDTEAHAEYFTLRYGVTRDRVTAIFVGAESDDFPVVDPLAPKDPADPLTVLFYGQFIPLHGIERIIEAAYMLDDGSIHWILIGSGQEEHRMRKMLEQRPIQNLEWIPWVNYEDLVSWIEKSDVCLGIFSNSEKASRVIPNKVFQVISVGRPLITRDSPAIRELLDEQMDGIYLVPADSGQAIADAISLFRQVRPQLVGEYLHSDVRQAIGIQGIGLQFRERVLQ